MVAVAASALLRGLYDTSDGKAATAEARCPQRAEDGVRRASGLALVQADGGAKLRDVKSAPAPPAAVTRTRLTGRRRICPRVGLDCLNLARGIEHDDVLVPPRPNQLASGTSSA